MDAALQSHARKIVDTWLKDAAGRLCDEARERVSNEVNEHFLDALETELAHGTEPAEALGRTLASLGQPEAARHGFERVYLTQMDEKALRRFRERPRGAGFSLMVWIFGAIVFFILTNGSAVCSWVAGHGWHGKPLTELRCLTIYGFIFLNDFSKLFYWFLVRDRTDRMALAVRIAFHLAIWIVMGGVTLYCSPVWVPLLLVFIAIDMIKVYILISIRRKLPSVSQTVRDA